MFIAGRHERRHLGVRASRSSARTSPGRCGRCCCARTTRSKVLMRFIWALPLSRKRKFVRAIDAHLSDRYPMFAGLSEGWPAGNAIPPHIREPQEREKDFGLVNKGYLGYLNVGFTRRRGRPARLARGAARQAVRGEALRGRHACSPAAPSRKGGCPVKIHIPAGARARRAPGKFHEALELHRVVQPAARTSPAGSARRSCSARASASSRSRPIAIGQLEWFLPEREKLVDPDGAERRFAHARRPVGGSGEAAGGDHRVRPLRAHQRLPPRRRGLPGDRLRGVPRARRRAALRHPGVPPAQRAHRRRRAARSSSSVADSSRNFVVGKTATIEELREAGFWRVFVGTGAGLPRFMDVPGEHYLNVMSANEFLTRVNLMQGLRDDYETPLPETRRQGGAGHRRRQHRDGCRPHRPPARRPRDDRLPAHPERDAGPGRGARARPRGGHHAARRCARRTSSSATTRPASSPATTLDVMELGEPDASGRRRPVRDRRAPRR